MIRCPSTVGCISSRNSSLGPLFASRNSAGTSMTGAQCRAAASHMTCRYGSHAFGPAFTGPPLFTSSLLARMTNSASAPWARAIWTRFSRFCA